MTLSALVNQYLTFPARLPDLPTRRPDDTGGPTYIVRAALCDQHPHGVSLEGVTQTGETLQVVVSLVAPGIARVLLEFADSDPSRVTLARLPSGPAVPVAFERSDGQIRLVSDAVSVQIDLDPFHVSFYGPEGRPILAQNNTDSIVTGRLNVLPLGFSVVDGQRVAFHDTFTVEPDEHFYGFGEKFTNLDKRGQRLEMWHYDAFGVHGERAYKNVPFFISTRGYGLFVDSVSAIRFDMAASNHAVFSLIVPDSALDYYVIMGPDPKTILSRYASLVSLPPLPPKWAFGLWMSCGFSQDSQQDVLRRARGLREHDVPCDVIHIDPYWMRMGCWSDLIWDTKSFPDPQSMIQEMKAQGFKVCLWINPYLGTQSERFAEAKEKGYLLKTRQGEIWVRDLWSGDHPPVGILDLTHPEAVRWFQESLRSLLRMGVDVFKTDFGEGIPADAQGYDGLTGERLHNLYPLLYNDAVAEVIREETGRSPLVWGRSTYAGGQRHAAQWAGDPNCTYQALASTLRGGLSIAMCGHAFWGHDLGGFHTRPTPEVYARWAQFGLFSPMSRAHGMTSRLPWEYGDELLGIFRDYVRLRYRLLPYIYTYASLAAETGLPIIRPMVLEFPDDPLTYTMDLQYMFGAEFLVAPIYNDEGRRPVYFPAGRWVDFWTHEIIEGPLMRHVTVPLGILPLYVKANALIPTIEPPNYIADSPFDTVTFDGYLIDKGSFELRDTDGMAKVSASLTGSRLDITFEGAKRKLGLRLIQLLGVSKVDAVHVNGLKSTQVEFLGCDPGVSSHWTHDENGAVLVLLG